jgi:F0F1-type ATP synthase epsilon subunit
MDNANVADISAFEQLQVNQNELHNVNLMSVFNDFNEVKRLLNDYVTTEKKVKQNPDLDDGTLEVLYEKLDIALTKEMSRIESLPETERAKAKKAVETEIKRVQNQYDRDDFMQHIR